MAHRGLLRHRFTIRRLSQSTAPLSSRISSGRDHHSRPSAPWNSLLGGSKSPRSRQSTLRGLHASPFPLLFGSRSYGTAEAESVVEADKVEDEEYLEEERKELSFVKSRSEEVRKRIHVLDGMDKRRQAQLEKRKEEEEITLDGAEKKKSKGKAENRKLKEKLVSSSSVNQNKQSSGPCGEDRVTNNDLSMLAKLRYGHPWLEWTEFLKHLEENGYFEDDGKDFPGRDISLEETSPVKHAVVRFGRDRDDIFSFISRKDIKVIVSFGCPDTGKKAVNAAKRLRAFCNIEEGSVCQQCRLKKSCEKAFICPPPDVAAGTPDVIQLLFSYALNALPGAHSYESYPEELISSICYLLKQLVLLTVNPRDTGLRKVAQSIATKHHDYRETAFKADDHASYSDWTCPNCNFLNIMQNKQCRECGVYRAAADMKPGDWECPNPICRFPNFARNTICMQCEALRSHIMDSRPGDWQCPNFRCRFHNFARNTVCFKCGTERLLHLEKRREEIYKGSRVVHAEGDFKDECGRTDLTKSRNHFRWRAEDDKPSGRGSEESYKGSRNVAPGEDIEDEREHLNVERSRPPRLHSRREDNVSKSSRGGDGKIFNGSRKERLNENFKDDWERVDW